MNYNRGLCILEKNIDSLHFRKKKKKKKKIDLLHSRKKNIYRFIALSEKISI